MLSDTQAADPVYPDALPALDQPAPAKKRSHIAVASESSYTDSHSNDSLSDSWYPPGEDSDGIVPEPAEIGAGIVPEPAEIGAGIVPEPAEIGAGIVPEPAEIGAGIVPEPAEIGAGIVPEPAEIGTTQIEADETQTHTTQIEADETQTHDEWKYDASEWWEEGEEEFPWVIDLIESTSGEEQQPTSSSSGLEMQTKVVLCSVLKNGMHIFSTKKKHIYIDIYPSLCLQPKWIRM